MRSEPVWNRGRSVTFSKQEVTMRHLAFVLAALGSGCVPTVQQAPAVQVAAVTVAPAPTAPGARRIIYDGAGRFTLPNGTKVEADDEGGFTLPNGAYVRPDGSGGVILPNGTRCGPDGAEGYVCP